MAYRKVFGMQKQWSIEAVRCINEWAKMAVEMPMKWADEPMDYAMSRLISESMNHWSNEAMIQRTKGRVNQWIDEWMNQWISVWMNQWVNEPVNQLINESMNRFGELMNEWINESVTQWTKKSMNQWIVNQWVHGSMHYWASKPSNEGMDGWMDGWMNEWMKWMNEMKWNEWMNEWNEWNEWMNEWNEWNEWMNEWKKWMKWMNEWMKWMDGWMDGRSTFLCWTTSSLSDLFAEAPLLSVSSSLSSHLFVLLVLWAASQLACV